MSTTYMDLTAENFPLSSRLLLSNCSLSARLLPVNLSASRLRTGGLNGQSLRIGKIVMLLKR
jgi:hypothetical protein